MSGETNLAWRLSDEWLEQWHLFQDAFYKWIPDRAALSGADRRTQPDRRGIFADAMNVARGDIASLDCHNWLAWKEYNKKAHLSHPKTVLGNVIAALRRDAVPEECGQDVQFDKNWQDTKVNRTWLADDAEYQLEMYVARIRQKLPPLPKNYGTAQKRNIDPAQKDMAAAQSYENSADIISSASQFEVVSFAELQRRGASAEDVLAGISTVFEKLVPLPPSVPGNDMGSDEKWDSLMFEFSSCVFLLLDKARICGYWMVLPVDDELYRDGLDGQNINKRLSLLDTEELSLPGRYNMYFVDLFVLPQYKDVTPNIKLLGSFVEFLTDLSRNGIFIRRMFANISSSAAEKTCMKIGFKFVRQHREHQSIKMAGDSRPVPSKIYELNLLGDERLKLWDYSQELADAYDIERTHDVN